MTGKNPLNDRAKREAALRDVLGDAKYEQNRESLETAESVREAARFVREMREHAGFTQGQLAEKLGVTQPRISEIERGNTPEGIGYALLRRVANACGFPNWPMSPVENLRKQSGIAIGITHPDRSSHDPVQYPAVFGEKAFEEIVFILNELAEAKMSYLLDLEANLFQDSPSENARLIREILTREQLSKIVEK
jgi:transcriptional regulator with XRE-family HTH domain